MNYAVSNDTMRISDSLTIGRGISAEELMQRAGEGIYALLPKDPSYSYAVVCGRGNNGGDGYVIADALFKGGYNVLVYTSKEFLTPVSEYFYNKLDASIIRDINTIVSLKDVDVAVDCLFGTGFHGELGGVFMKAAQALNCAKYVVACDIPSGLNGDNGRACEYCVKADMTVAIGSIKSGHLLNDGKDFTGEIKVLDIGIEIVGERYLIADETLLKRYFVKRKNNTHKGSYGSVGIVGCSARFAGAGKLAAVASLNVIGESVLRIGAGLCKLCVPDEMLEAMWGCVNNVTLLAQSDIESLDTDVIAFGMGAGNTSETLILLKTLLPYQQGLIIDADGLNALAKDIELLKSRKGLSVITPHIKEMSRLSGLKIDDILNNPIGTAKEFAKKYGCIVVLKGDTTVISDGNSVILSASGSAGQAKGGSGDVLSGVIAAILAGNIKQKRLEDIEAVAAAVYLCGLAGERAAEQYGEYGMTAMDTALNLALSIKQIAQ